MKQLNVSCNNSMADDGDGDIDNIKSSLTSSSNG